MSEARKKRGDETRERLMRAAEYLAAIKGLENITVRAIVQEAAQKNESALQYHFKNMQGLLNAVHEDRNAEVRQLRAEMAGDFLSAPRPSLRDLCRLMVIAPFKLAKNDESFRYYLRGFGPRVAHSSKPVQMMFENAKGELASFVFNLLEAHLPHLSAEQFYLRLDSTLRFVALSLAHQAAIPKGFSGKQGDQFITNLMDMMVGMLAAPVSDESKVVL